MKAWLETVVQDLRYGARQLRANKAFAVVAILSLALGIGANTAIFQLIDAVRLRTLPVKDPDTLAFVNIPERHWTSGNVTGYYSWLTNPMWEQIRQDQQVFSSVAAFGGERMNLARGGEARRAVTLFVSGEFFQTLGVPALMGRVFTANDDKRGCAAPGAVISYSLWQREFGGASNVIGKTLTVESHPFDIIGVTPASFYGVEVGRNYEAALPLCAEPTVRGEYTYLDLRRTWWLGVVGRLKPGVTLKQANAQMQAISREVFEATIPAEYDAEGRKHYLEYKLGANSAANGTSRLRRQYEQPLWLLLGIAGLVLLIACANLANLMLARASARERELAVRLALGARRQRLIRQLLFESLLMALIGAALGAVMAQAVSRGLIAFLSTQDQPVVVDLGLDWRLLGFTGGLAVLTCLLFGLTPALRATNTPPAAAMNAGGRTIGASREKFGLRRALVVTQIALSLVLVAGALLFVGSLRNLLTLDAGFQQSGLLITDVDFSRLPIPKDQRQEYKRQIAERVRALPGVEDAATVDIVPISGNSWNQNIVIGGKSPGDSLMNRVSDHYFRTMGTPLLAGRDFGPQDTASSPRVAIVNEAAARKYFSGNAIGKTFHVGVYAGEPDPEFQIVGVVANAKYRDLREEFSPVTFFALAQDSHPDQETSVLIRSAAALQSLTAELKRSFAELNPEITISFISFQGQIRDGLLRERLMATLSGFFGVLAGILAAIGIYGVIAYMVARRTNEIGVRMALGATPANVLAMILKEAGVLLAAGAAAGLLLATLGARTAKALLFGVAPDDPKSLLVAVAVLGVIAIAASYWPAHRAARLEPMKALREE